MRNITYLLLALPLVAVLVAGCTGCGGGRGAADADSLAVPAETVDTTVYGVCGAGTSMHALELVTDAGDTLTYLVDTGDDESASVLGGMMAGDRMAVVGHEGTDGDRVATRALNLTTLLGKWTSLDKNFEIEEGGTVESRVKAEAHPWTSWRVLNGQLILGRDTFSVDRLTADSLYLENGDGIFVYKRIP